MKITFVRMVLAALSGCALVLGSPVAAEAASSPLSVVVNAGRDARAVGTATFARSTAANGSETLTIHFSVPAGIDASHVCLRATPYTQRINAGSCPYAQDATGTSADYSIDLGTAYAGKTVYVQASVVTGEDTAFAGWTSGSPFYGNVSLAADTTDVPVATLGGLGLAVLLTLGFVTRLRLQRNRPRP